MLLGFELGHVGAPSLAFGHGAQETDGQRGHVGVGGSGEDALPVDLDAEADHVQRFGGLVPVSRASSQVGSTCLVAGSQSPGPALPDRQVIAVLMKRNEADRTLTVIWISILTGC